MDKATFSSISPLLLQNRLNFVNWPWLFPCVANYVSRLGRTVILPQGATALGVDTRVWQQLASAHANNENPTKIVIFETEKTQLSRTSSYQSLAGGYTFCEYDLHLIGRYLDSAKPPEPYDAHFLSIGKAETKTDRVLPRPSGSYKRPKDMGALGHIDKMMPRLSLAFSLLSTEIFSTLHTFFSTVDISIRITYA